MSHFQGTLQRVEVIVSHAVGSVTNLKSFEQLIQEDRLERIFGQGH